MSYDHKPVDRAESQRIIAAGGFVEFGRVNGNVPMKQSSSYSSTSSTISGNLALSRAIGDFEFKQNESLPQEEQVVTCKQE